MVKNKQAVEDVEAMRDSLVHEGWMVRDDLPKGWRVRRQGKKNKLDFMTPSGKWFPSLGNARAHVEKFGPCDFDFARLKKNLQEEQSNNKKGLVVGQKYSQKANVVKGGDEIAAKELSTNEIDKFELMESVSGADSVDHNPVAGEGNQEESLKQANSEKICDKNM